MRREGTPRGASFFLWVLLARKSMWDFEAIYRQHAQAVFGYTLRCVGRRDLAEDITSEAFLALYRNRDRVHQDQLPAWLFTVAKNRAVDYWRRAAVEQRYTMQQPEESTPPEQEASLDSWLLESKTLKPLHRVCLMLRYVHGMTRSEIAQRTGLSENQIKGCVQYALEMLRKEISKEGHEQRAQRSPH